MRLEMSFGGIDAILLFNLFSAMVLNVQASFVETPRDCKNKILHGMKGNFTSPGGFDGYPNNTVCSWIVEASHNSRILVTFHNFDLEWSKTCLPYDYVKVSDKCNNTNEWSENLMTSDGSEVTEGFCGNMTMFNVTSRCGNVHVEFRSDDSITGRGFNATFEVIRDKNKPEIMPFCFGGNKTTCTDRKVETATNTIRLECEVEANPQAEVHWLYLGTSTSNPPRALDSRDFRMTDFRNGTLEIKKLRRNDTGFYQCVANNSLGNDTTAMELFVKEKCKCPKTIHANWYLIPPYIREGIHHEPGGLFPLLLPDIVQQCCGNCTGGDGPSKISYSHRHDTLDEIKHVKNFDQMDTITFPISGKKDDRYYQNEYKFMPLISSPGVAFIIVDEPPGTSAKAVFNSVLSGWPVLLLTLLMALLSGMIMWGLDTWYNPDEFPRSFIKGSGEGFWWAFVTMTTVGYGDRSPRGFLARIFAIVWVLVGLVITSIFTGVVTTSLTAITLSTDVKLYGTQIGAVANSTEYRLGLNKNAKLKAFTDLHSMVTALKKRDFKGVLVDTYVAGEYDEFSSEELRVNKIIDHNSYYGVVFGPGDLSGGEFQHCFEDYVLSNKAAIFETVKENTKPMDKPSESAAVERSSGLFDSSSPLFQNSVYTCLGLLLFFTACGIIWDYGYMRHWRKRSELDELELLGGPGYELAKRNLDMMDALMLEVQEFYENWTKRLDDITERHEEEQKIQSKQQKK